MVPSGDRSSQPDAPFARHPERLAVAVPLVHPFLDHHVPDTHRGLDLAVLDEIGKSLRAAVRSNKGRDQVVAWLKYLENAAARAWLATSDSAAVGDMAGVCPRHVRARIEAALAGPAGQARRRPLRVNQPRRAA